LDLVVDREHTGTGDTTEDVGTGTLEERADTFLGDDLAAGVDGGLVLDGLSQLVLVFNVQRMIVGCKTHFTRSHHHTTTDRVERVGGDTSTGGDSPAEQEGGQEVTLERADEEDGLDGVVHAEVETAVDDDTSDGGHETTVETSDTIRGESLFVDIDETVELTLTTLLCALGVVGETGTGVIEGVDEEEGRSTGGLYSTMSTIME
jgi:hypothetical protein